MALWRPIRDFDFRCVCRADPTPDNPTGYAPYSVHWSSCEPCRLGDTLRSFFLAWNYFFFLASGVILYLLRNINDQVLHSNAAPARTRTLIHRALLRACRVRGLIHVRAFRCSTSFGASW